EDRSANLRKRGRMPLPALRPDLIHRPGEGTSLREGWCPTRPKAVVLSLSDHCGASLGGWVEGGIVSEHAMHDHSELAGDRDLGFGHAGAPGDAHAPALEL